MQVNKRVNKILWYGNELNEDGKAKAPAIATTGGDGTDGLNAGEIYICNANEDPAIFVLTDEGRVARISGGDSTYTRNEVDEKLAKKVDTAFFAKLFNLIDSDGNAIEVNDIESTASSIKAMLGLWTDQYLSAKGLNPDAGGTVSGATTLAELTDVTLSTPTDGQVLTYNSATNTWINADAAGGLDEQALAQYLTTNQYVTQNWVTQQSFATQEWVNEKGYATQQWVTQQLGSYVTTTSLTSTLSSYATKDYVTNELKKKVDVAFFSRLFGLMDEDGDEITVNDVSTLAESIKLKLGAWTEGYLSAKGKNPSAGGTVAGASSLSELEDVNLSGLSNNQILAYNAASGKWINVDMPSGGASSWDEITGKPTTLAGYGITASDVLTTLKTVDGTGSGLDADTLDGVHNGNVRAQSFTTRSTTDFDAQTDSGFFSWNESSANKPSPNYGTMLQFANVSDPTPGTNQQWINQLAWGTNNRIYVRQQINGGSWTSWEGLAYLTDNVASASKLQTTHYIWGQPFNGEQNVTGALTGVTSITASGNITTTAAVSASTYLQVGSARLKWDSANNALYVEKSDGEQCGFYATGFVSTKGANSSGGGVVAGATSLDELDDVSLAGLSAGQILGWNGSAWTNVAMPDSGASSWNEITGKPTTLAGYGITDAYTKEQGDARYAYTDGSNATGTWPISISNQAGYLRSYDTRDVDNLPSEFDAGARFEFKSNTTDGLADGNNYHGILQFRPYGNGTNFTGGQSHQLGFTDGGNVWHRISSGSDGWGAWRKLLDTTNYSSTLDNRYVKKSGDTVTGTLTVQGLITASGGLTTSQYIQVGSARLKWDSANNALYVEKSDGEQCGFYATGFVSTKGANSSGGGVVAGATSLDELDDVSLAGLSAGQILGWNGSAWTNVAKPAYTWNDITDKPSWIGSTKPSYTWSEIGSKPTSLSGFGITDGVNSVTVSGSGNAVTAASISGHQLTLTKGSTFLLSSAYTASDVLAKLKTVDGSGSGLDADTLDGVHNGNVRAQSFTTRSTTDFDAQTDSGFFSWNESSANKPSPNYGTMLQFANVSDPTPGTYNQWINQLAWGTNNRIYVRQQINGGAWTSWQGLAYLTDNVASASKLQTTHYFWGQPFNGEQNVTGALTGVTSITASGNITTSSAVSASTYLQVGSARLKWDSTNGALYVEKSDGTTCGFYATGFVSAKGANDDDTDIGLGIIDVRNENITPLYYKSSLMYLFKQNSSDGLNDGGTYHSVLNLVPWADLSGGDPTQLGFTDNGNIWMRKATSSTEWSDWRNITSLAGMSDVEISSPSNGQSLVYRNGTWNNETVSGGGGGLTSVSLSDITDLNSSWDSLLSSAPTNYVKRWPTWSEVTSKPSWIGSSKPSYSFSEITGSLSVSVSSTSSRNLSITVEGSTDYVNDLYATQLATSRNIWGRPFNGTANVSGDMTGVGNIDMSGELNGFTTLYSAGYTDNRRFVITNGASMYVIASTGNWVAQFGARKKDGSTVIVQTAGIYGTADSLNYCYYGGTYTSPAMVITPAKNVGIGTTSPGYKLHVAGSAYATGGFNSPSDLRLKSILRPTSLSVQAIADAPSFLYTWKRGEDKAAHAGGSAQYWRGVLPEVVTEGADGWLAMEYDRIAYAAVVSIAREVLSVTRRIDELEKENRDLKQRITQLERRAA